MVNVGEAAAILAKLPQPDAEQVKAIAGSVPGRLLARTAALLALLALLLGWYAVLWNYLLPSEIVVLRDTHPRWFAAIFFVAPLLIVAGQLVIEWVQHRRARRMQERVLRGEVRDPGYFRLTPYTARQRAAFQRADHAHERVREWIEDAREPILFLTGDSGTGKSSLLQAHVIPALGEAGWHIVTARSFADPLGSLRAALTEPGAIWKSPPDEADPYELLAQAAQRLGRDRRRLCIVLDQFEEFVILHGPEARAGFTGLLQRLAEEPIAGLRLVLVLRSEYEAALAEAGLPRLRQGENWFKLGAFTEPAARAFLQGSGLDLAPEAFGRLLRGAAALEATRGLYRPIVLNLLGLVLARHAGQLPPGFNPERVIQDHLRQSITAADLREDAALILPRMITEAGTKRPVEETTLAAEAGLPPVRVRHCLLRLADGALVRPLGREQLWWEVGHDFIATQLGLLLGRLRAPVWRQALPYAVPALAVLWIATTAALGWLWPAQRIAAAIAALSAHGFTVSGNSKEGFRISSLDLEKGAATELGRHIRSIQPLLSLAIGGNDALQSLPSLEGLAGLQQLTIGGNAALQSLPSLEGLAGLQQLTIGGNDALQSLPSLEGLAGLQQLSIGNNAALQSLPSLEGLAGLQRIALQGPFTAAALPELAQLSALKMAVLSDEDEITADLHRLGRKREEAGLPALEVRRLRPGSLAWYDPFS